MPQFGSVVLPDAPLPTGVSSDGAPPVAARPSLGSILSAATQQAYGQVRYGIPLAVEKMRGTLDQADNDFYTKGLADASAAAQTAAPATAGDVFSGKVGVVRGVAENLAALLPQVGAGLAGGIAGTAVGGPVGGFLGATIAGAPVLAGANVQRAVDENGGLSSAAAERSLAASPFQAAGEQLLTPFLPGLGHAAGAAEQAATSGAGFLMRTAQSMGKAGLTQAAVAATQQIGSRYAAGDDLTSADAVSEYVSAAATGFAVGGVIGAGGGFRRGPALAKPAAEVTTADNLNYTNDVLNGKQGQLPGPPGAEPAAPAGPIGLPSPDQFPVFGQPITVGSDGTAITPEQGTLTTEGRAAATPAAPVPTAEDLNNASFANADNVRQAGDQVRDILAGRGPQSAIPDALAAPAAAPDFAADIARRARSGDVTLPENVTGTANAVEASKGRVFRDEPLSDIQNAIKKAAPGSDIHTEATTELATRVAEAAGTAPLTAPFETRLAEAKDGLRSQFITKLTADNPGELLTKVADRVFGEDQGGVNDGKLAQRLGIMDDKGNPTDLGKSVLAEKDGAAPAEAAPAETGTPAEVAPTETAPAASPEAVAEAPAAPADEAKPAAPVAKDAPGVVLANQEVDPEFQKQFDELRKAAGIDPSQSSAQLKAAGLDTAPPNIEAARQRAIDALGKDSVMRNTTASPVEKLNQELGLIDKNRDLTELGHKTFLTTADGSKEIANAGRQLGLDGTQTDAFRQGAVATATGRETAHSTVENLAAYQQGKVWAEHDIKQQRAQTDEQTRATQGRTSARRTNEMTAAELRAAAQDGKGALKNLTPEQIRAQSQSHLLDAAEPYLRNVPDTEVASLRKMARSGSATNEEFSSRLDSVREGKVQFRESDTKYEIKGERPDPRHPLFKEMNTPERGLTKAESRGETESAVRTFKLRETIKQALEDEEISKAKADKLQSMLDEGKVNAVAVITKDFGTITRSMKDDTSDLDHVLSRRAVPEKIQYGKFTELTAVHPDDEGRRVPSGPVFDERRISKDRNEYWRSKAAQALDRTRTSGPSDLKFEQGVIGKSFNEAADYMVEHAPSPYLGKLMEGIKDLAAKITAAGGHEFVFKVVRPGDQVPRALNDTGTRGLAHLEVNPSRSTVYLKSAELGPAAGTNFQIAAHEMLHAVTMRALQFGRRADQVGTAIGNATKDLATLGNALIAHFNARVKEVGAENLTPFEKDIYERRNNVFQNSDEVLAWGMTNPDFQRYMQTIEYGPRQSTFSKMVSLVRNMLGIKGEKANTALTELMRVSEQIHGLDQRDLEPMFARDQTNGLEHVPLQARLNDSDAASAATRTVEAANNVAKGVVDTVVEAASKIPYESLKSKAERTALGFLSLNMVRRTYAHIIPALDRYVAAKQAHDAVRGRISTLAEASAQAAFALKAVDKKMYLAMMDFMHRSTINRIDVTKDFEAHEHLGISKDSTGVVKIEEGKEADVAKDRKTYDELTALKRTLQSNDGAGWKVYNSLLAHNQMENFAKLAVDLHSLVAYDPEFKLGVAGSGVNPMDTFMNRAGIATVGDARAHWQQALVEQVKAVQDFIVNKKGELPPNATKADKAGLSYQLDPLSSKLSEVKEALQGMDRAPYFHLGRFGDHFASATIAKLENGRVNPAAQAHVDKVLWDAGFKNIQISSDLTNPKFSTRLESVDATNLMRSKLLELEASGHLEPNTVQAGPRDMASNYGVMSDMPRAVQVAIANLENSPRFKAPENATPEVVGELAARKAEAVGALRDAWIEGQADSSISKVMSKRANVAGYETDMMRNWAFRAKVGAGSLANASTSLKLGESMSQMRQQLIDARRGNSQIDPEKVSNVLGEMEMRNAKMPLSRTVSAFDQIRSYGHAYFLGMNPAYAAMQLMQVGTNGVPELAKVHGYTASFHAVRRAGVDSLAVLRAAMAEAQKGGLAHAADLKLTENVLANSGLSETKKEFLRRIIASGSINIGQSATALDQTARSSKHAAKDVFMNYAGAMGMHAEAFSRLAVALAAHELHDGDLQSKTDYARKTISESMFDFQSSNTARQLGKRGFAGPITPLLTQFMSYTTQMTEKLYSEAASSVGKARFGETPEETAERARQARTYLAGHLTAVTALAGSLGLPFAGAFAAGLEKLVNNFGPDDKPFDATASWRNFLAHVLGKDVGEVVARGIPRLAGLDLSTRMGEAELLPFTGMLSDRRNFHDSFTAAFGKMSGASTDMFLGVADAAHQIGQGDVLGGMKMLAPVGLKNPLEAYRMSTEGYVDTQGRKLPISAGAGAILYQLMGFSPEQKAEYSEQRNDDEQMRTGLVTEAKNRTNAILRAITNKDQPRATTLIESQQKWDAANHEYAVLPHLGQAVARLNTVQAQARALGTPLGVKPTDIAARELTSYANIAPPGQ